jgi:ATP-dependent helicase/nuclease subunit B
MKSPQRVFLDWQRPALVAAVEWLRRTYGPASPAKGPTKKASTAQRQFNFDEPAPAASGAAWDLSQVIVVVPGKRAGRRLLELLCFEARDHNLHFTPPTITTEGRLPEMLYAPKRPFADSLTQDLAWSHALRRLRPSQLQAIVPHPPEKDNETAWLQLGNMLRVRHTELAADTLTFDSVVQHGRTLERFPDAARWEAMSAAQNVYLRSLDDLLLWDIQTARLKAIEFQEIQTDKQIVLLGTVDLNRTLRKMLDMVAGQVTALIAAPESLADRFDGHGCVLPEQWREVPIPVGDDQIRRVDGPADQADAVAQIMAGFEGRYRGDQITVGVPDEKLVSHLQRQLEQCELPVRWVEGKRLSDTRPFRLLDAIAELLRTETMRAFASLVRHPDVFQRLTYRSPGASPDEEHIELCILDEIDRLQSDYLVTRLNPKYWPAEVRRKLEEKTGFCNVVKATEHLHSLLVPFRAKPQRLALWSQPVLAVLQTVYPDQCDDPHTLAALEKIRDTLQAQTLLPEQLDPRLTADEAIAWTLDQLQGEAIPPPASEEAVELLGWLELPLDDAPAVIVTTFNEGFTPQSTSGDSFLPNSLRTSLGLLDNDRRYARDACAISTILASRESVHLISARRDAEENPLVPSRLLFAAEPAEVVARARKFFQPLAETSPRAPLVGAGVPLPKSSQLFVPLPPDNLELPTQLRLRVTQFRDYLACPYRFCLKHLLKLEGIDDACEELEANAFGNILHKVLERFGANKAVRDSADEDEIFEFLREQLRQSVGLRYGDRDRLAAVEIQIEQMRARLQRFAAWQAQHRADGWHILYSETTDEEDETAKAQNRRERDAELLVDGIPFLLGGRIDRIDQHEDGERLRIFDYKTGDSADPPEQVHRRRRNGERQWVDLQLPLYRHLAEAWGYEGEMDLGYILIPKALDRIDASLADWSEDDLATADATMRDVVRRIRNREFWPPQDMQWLDDFSSICQDRRLGGRLFHAEMPEASLT